MFRNMRRSRQKLDHAECEAILRRATSGVLSLVGDDGYPYGVPLSFAYRSPDENPCAHERTEGIASESAVARAGLVDSSASLGMLVFHSALTGHKIDAITADPKASFTVVELDDVLPEKYTTRYRSVIAFGNVRIVEARGEKLALLRLLGDRYWPGHDRELEDEIAPRFDRMHVLAFEIAHLTGKQAIELM